MKLMAVVLAAGSAGRFGASKQLAEYCGEPLVTRAVRAAEAVCGERTLLVVGNDWQQVHRVSAPLSGFLLHNDEYASGMAGSIAAAVRAVGESSDAILLTLCDQPLVGALELQTLIDAWRASPGSIICSSFDDVLGPPAVFPAAFFDELVALRGDNGARAVLDKHRDRVFAVPCQAAASDVDTPADLETLTDRAT